MNIIKIITREGKSEAISLIGETFDEFDASYYTRQGADKFHAFFRDEKNFEDCEFFGAFEENNDELLGVIVTKDNRRHIVAFFVRGRHHKKGIGKALFGYVVSSRKGNRTITVNAAPYATEIYHRLGFTDTDAMKEDGGLKYTPMKYEIKD